MHIAPETLRLALTHRSYSYENDGIPTNERLEFLGDSVLGFSVTDYLYRTYPDLPEGDLAKLRSALVSTRALARIARSLDIGPHISLGTGERRTKGQQKDSILADTMERSSVPPTSLPPWRRRGGWCCAWSPRCSRTKRR